MKGRRLGRREAEELLSGRAGQAAAPAEDTALASILAAARLPLDAPDSQQRRETVAAMAAAVWRPETAPEAPPAVAPARRRLARISTAGSRVALGAGVGTLALFGSLTTASALSGTVAAAVHHTLGITLPLAHATAPAPPAPAAPAAVGNPVPRPRHRPASGHQFVPPQPVFAGVEPGAGADGDLGRADGQADHGQADHGRHGDHSDTVDNPGQVRGADESTPTAPATSATRPERDDHQVTSGSVMSDDSTPPTYRYGPDGRRDTGGGVDRHRSQPSGAAPSFSGKKHPAATHDRRAPSFTRTSTTKPTTDTPSSTSSSTTSSTTVPAAKAGWSTTGTTHSTDGQFNS